MVVGRSDQLRQAAFRPQHSLSLLFSTEDGRALFVVHSYALGELNLDSSQPPHKLWQQVGCWGNLSDSATKKSSFKIGTAVECVEEDCAPVFPLEFDPNDHSETQKYCDALAHYRRQAFLNPGLTFDHNTSKPSFQLSVPSLASLRSAGRQFPTCAANWYLETTRPASSLRHPEPSWADPTSEYECPRNLAGVENLVSNALENCYGKHKLAMPHGESTHVILMEYIKGTTLAQLQDKYPSHDTPRYNPLPQKSYSEWLDMAKELYISALRGMRNMMIASTTSLKQVVYIDFAFAELNARQDLIDAH
ncbi:uncharacterized protein BT62DRAFT_1081663 [Guyanagaster necrorhizus]|uniref:Uncharacterized protein n=1 Tax=Guyanagaster necrorhizus TaxID=856835 RepID=A0A9P8AL22_9AGAR|nr:uncharacterized protein BT62DRAFT_1081663 [Guyanagaster necrorhizus MCA 3950]KAG7439310.1 hypothetical protein BT62DRAFT_1081663 [Guyanagaster necrorhizus MCA 3950]